VKYKEKQHEIGRAHRSTSLVGSETALKSNTKLRGNTLSNIYLSLNIQNHFNISRLFVIIVCAKVKQHAHSEI